LVEIVITLDESALLNRMTLRGHAGPQRRRCSFRPSRGNPACAAVTLAARSAARAIAAQPGWTVDGGAPKPGDLSLAVLRRPGDTDEWLRGVTDTLMQTLADIDEEYPEAISVRIEELQHGS